MMNAYMNKVQISHAGIYQSLKRSQSNSLHYSCPDQTFIIQSTSTSPSAADSDEESPQKVQMSFAPYSCGGDEKESCNADST